MRWVLLALLVGIGAAHAQAPQVVAPPCYQGAACTIVGGNVTAQVPTNGALKALPTGAYSVVYRAGFTTAGDGGAMVYVWSGTACSLNSGAGDNGSQVAPTTGTGCWIAALSDQADPRVWGAVGDGSTSDSAAFTSAATALSAHGGGTIRVHPTGHAYYLGSGITLPTLVSMEGDGMANWPGLDGSVAQWTAAGSWIQCADTVNVCVTVNGVGSLIRGVNFINAQATPPTTGAWTPTIYPYVIAINGSANFSGVENVSITAATHCIDIEGPSSGVAGIWTHLEHVWFNGCFVRGTKFHLIDNTVSMHDLRYDNWWYSDHTPVVTYMEANKVDWDLQYLANAQASDIEFLQSYRAIQLTDATVNSGFGNVTFAANDLQLANVSFNEVCQAIVPTASTTHGSGALSNVIAYGDSTTNCYGTPTYMFDFSSNSANWDISNLDAGYVQSLMNVGASSTIKLNNADVQAYSEVSAGAVAFNIQAGGELLLSGTPSNAIRPAAGAGQLYSGIPTPEWQANILAGSTFGAVLADGEFGLRRNVASGTAPGGGFIKFGAVCGTNAGTAKIVVYGGTSTTPVTLLDNIGSGVTGC